MLRIKDWLAIFLLIVTINVSSFVFFSLDRKYRADQQIDQRRRDLLNDLEKTRASEKRQRVDTLAGLRDLRKRVEKIEKATSQPSD